MANILDSYILGAACWFEDKELGFVTGEVTRVNLQGDNVELEFKDEKGRVSSPSSLLQLCCYSCKGRRKKEEET